jgi:dTDP-4-dehydrorhamnose reductase
VKKSKKKIFLFGGSGMLGSMVLCYLSRTGQYEIHVFVRRDDFNVPYQEDLYIHQLDNLIDPDGKELKKYFFDIKPSYAINCVGLIKQKVSSELEYIRVNALLPHYLNDLCRSVKSKLIHFSTDCVFTGEKGFYSEIELPDASDMYGRSKLLGEVVSNGALTLRTSIVGPELYSNTSLLEWFLSRDHAVSGFTHAIFSGLTTLEISKIVHRIMCQASDLSGLYHLSMDPVSKHDLLCIIRDAFNHNVTIHKDSTLVIDRSLDSKIFKALIGYTSPNWNESINELSDFNSCYKEFYNV